MKLKAYQPLVRHLTFSTLKYYSAELQLTRVRYDSFNSSSINNYKLTLQENGYVFFDPFHHQKQFNLDQKNLLNSYHSNTGNSRRNNHDNGNDNNSNNNRWFKGITFTGIIGIVIGGVYWIIDKVGTILKPYNEINKTHEAKIAEREKLYKDLKKLGNNCSAAAIRLKDKQNINDFSPKAEKLIQEILQNKDLVGNTLNILPPKDYLLHNKGSKAVAYILHLTNSVSNYYMFKEHDGIKAKSLLLKSKAVAEEFLELKKLTSGEKFDTLTNDEKITALKEYDSIAKVYALTIYLLGRTYIYSGNKAERIEYFKFAKHLGEEFKLFSAVLSERGGICLIEEQIINNYLKDNECPEAKKQILDTIEKYKALKNDDNDYIESFHPKDLSKEQKPVKPVTDDYHQLECDEQLLKYYGKLIAIGCNEEKEEFLHLAREILFGNNENKNGLFENVKVAESGERKNPQKIASIYNTLGNFLIIVRDTGIEHEKLQNDIATQLSLSNFNSNIETLIHKVFSISNKKTSYVNFTKADSYNGLIEICKRENALDNCSLVSDFKMMRDSINTQFKRKMDFEDPTDFQCFVKKEDGFDDTCNCIGNINVDEAIS